MTGLSGALRAATVTLAGRRGGEARRGALAIPPMLVGYAAFVAVVGATAAGLAG